MMSVACWCDALAESIRISWRKAQAAQLTQQQAELSGLHARGTSRKVTLCFAKQPENAALLGQTKPA